MNKLQTCFIFFTLQACQCLFANINQADISDPSECVVPPFGHVDALVIYSCDPSSDQIRLPEWYDDICDPENPYSIPNYFKDISFGKHTLTMRPVGLNDKDCLVSDLKLNPNPSVMPSIDYFNNVMYKADMIIDFEDYDLNKDGFVDYVFFVVVNRGGSIGLASGYSYETEDYSEDGKKIRVLASQCSLNRVRNHLGANMLLTHEYGHALGLPDLDHSSNNLFSHISVGGFGLMVNGNGFGDYQGCIIPPLRVSSTYLYSIGWIDPISISYTKTRKIRDFQTSGEIYLLESCDSTQYFFVTNHQKLSRWEYYWPGKGLLIWHMNEKGAQPDRLRKQIDLEAAHGLYEWDLSNHELLINTLVENPEDGLDSMDVRGVYDNWRMKGNASCFFKSGYNETFDISSNPGSQLHLIEFPYSQKRDSHVYVKNIRDDPDENHVILADMCNNAWTGCIKGDETWKTERSPYFLTGDLIVQNGSSLTIEAGVEVIATGNYRLFVDWGSTLIAEGTNENPVVFTSLDSTWTGLRFYHASDNTKLTHCIIEKADYGAYCNTCLPIFEDCTFQLNTIDTYYVNRPLKQRPEILVPEDYYLGNCFPNPFNPETTIPFGMPVNCYIRINIFDLQGRLVNTLTNREYSAGYHEIVFDGLEYANGIYFIQLEMKPSDGSTKPRIYYQKLMIVK